MPCLIRCFQTILIALTPIFTAYAEVEELEVAIVIDDGPAPEHTEGFLNLFAERGIHVTFALIGERVAQHPNAAQAIEAAGHEIVNHSFSHAHPKPLSDEDLKQEVVGGQEAIAARLKKAPTWYWPPYAETDPRMDALFERANIRLYSPRAFVSSEDWNHDVDAMEIYQRATTDIVDGAVILFHEWRAETLQQMPAILDELHRQNCRFLTFSQLANTSD